MSGAIFETHVLTELLKSWWHRGRSPTLYYYRDKDQKEVDFLLVEDQTLYPVEVKKSASPTRADVQAFSRLAHLGLRVGPGVVVCLRQEALPLTDAVEAIPVSMI